MTDDVHHGEIPVSAGPPPAQGLYDPRDERDACGVGFVVDIKGRKSNTIVRQALQVLINLAHRGACGCETNTGDGAGILIQVPDRFLRKVAPAPLPPPGEYGVGLVFLPREDASRAAIERWIAEIVVEEGQQLLGWRDVPTDDSPIGPSAVRVEPVFKHVFIGTPDTDRNAFERRLYVIRKRIEHAVDTLGIADESRKFFYIVGLSCNTLIYKGMLTASQIETMFPDLLDPSLASSLPLVHQRFRT